MIFSMERRNILIFHAGALGDFVLTWFLPLALRRVRPGCEITYVTHASKGRLGARFLKTAWNDLDVNGWHSLHGATPALGFRARELLDRAEGAICFLGEEFAAGVRGVAPQMTVSCVKPIPADDWSRHVCDFYVEQLAKDLPREAMEQSLGGLWSEAVQAGRPANSRVVLHIGAGSLKKCWPTDCFMEVASRLSVEGHEVAIMAGEAELERIPERVMEQIRSAFPLVCPRDYLELAEELLNAKLLVTADNGPGHLAAALGCGVLSLFGPTKAQVWRPIGPRTKAVQGQSMQAISVSKVLDALEEWNTAEHR